MNFLPIHRTKSSKCDPHLISFHCKNSKCNYRPKFCKMWLQVRTTNIEKGCELILLVKLAKDFTFFHQKKSYIPSWNFCCPAALKDETFMKKYLEGKWIILLLSNGFSLWRCKPFVRHLRKAIKLSFQCRSIPIVRVCICSLYPWESFHLYHDWEIWSALCYSLGVKQFWCGWANGEATLPVPISSWKHIALIMVQV